VCPKIPPLFFQVPSANFSDFFKRLILDKSGFFTLNVSLFSPNLFEFVALLPMGVLKAAPYCQNSLNFINNAYSLRSFWFLPVNVRRTSLVKIVTATLNFQLERLASYVHHPYLAIGGGILDSYTSEYWERATCLSRPYTIGKRNPPLGWWINLSIGVFTPKLWYCLLGL